jgi:hypothetical protein
MLKEVDDAAKKALAAMKKARDDEAAAQIEIEQLRAERALIERNGVTRRLKDETADLTARADADAATKKKVEAVDSESEAYLADIDKLDRDDARKRNEIRKHAAEKIDAITVDAPRATSAYGAIGGMMGAQNGNADRLRDQRAAALEAINREQNVLLAQIKERLDE